MDVVESKRLVIRIRLKCELLYKNYPNVLTLCVVVIFTYICVSLMLCYF